MAQSAFKRTTSESKNTAKKVLDLASFRSRRSLHGIINALKVIQVAEATSNVSGLNFIKEPTKLAEKSRSVDGTVKALHLVEKLSAGERHLQFARRMFAITGDSAYSLFS